MNARRRIVGAGAEVIAPAVSCCFALPRIAIAFDAFAIAVHSAPPALVVADVIAQALADLVDFAERRRAQVCISMPNIMPCDHMWCREVLEPMLMGLPENRGIGSVRVEHALLVGREMNLFAVAAGTPAVDDDKNPTPVPA